MTVYKNQMTELRSLARTFLFILLGIFLLVLLGIFIFSNEVFAELTVNANHDHIKIDFFYNGSTVSISGLSEANTDLIIKIASPEGHEVLKQKGKVAGFLWMNTGTLKFENVPNLYSIHSTRKIEEILNQEEMDKYIIGYPSLEKHIEITSVANEEEKTKLFDEFLKYKESSNLYTNTFGNIATRARDSKQNYYIKTNWPYQAPPGEYLVTVYAIKGKKVVEKAEARVSVEQVGIVKTLFDMAKNKGALYGIISIIAALGAGFGVGLIFRKSGGAH